MSLADISSCRFRWLGHLARIGDHCLPKEMLFGWLPQCHSPHGVRLCWRDRMRQDLKCFHINESNCYVAVQERDQWNQLCVASPSLSGPVQLEMF